MCEYCGYQSIDAIRQLTAEHDELQALAAEVGRAAARDDWPSAQQVTRLLVRRLAPHTEIEERGLFPAMAVDFDEHVESLVGDHRRLDAQLAAIVDAEMPPPQWIQRLQSALHDLVMHIFREQDGLFPASVNVLSTEDWDRLDDLRRRIAGAAPDVPTG